MNDFLLIGGSPSSGSTLLMKLLARHKNVLALPETGLFAHGKNFLGRATEQIHKSLHLQLPWLEVSAKVATSLGWRDFDLAGELDKYETILDFMSCYIAPGSNKYFLEKTPENIFSFYTYLSQFPPCKVVVTSRDCLGVVQSMMRRNFSLTEAILIWFSHSYETYRLLTEFPDRVFHCQYESLTKNPEKAFEDICEFWKLDQEIVPKASRPQRSLAGDIASMSSLVVENIIAPKRAVNREMVLSEDDIRLLFLLSGWSLSDSAWTHAPWEEIVHNTPENFIGLEYDVMLAGTVFEIGKGAYLKPAQLNAFLTGTAGGKILGKKYTGSELHQLPLLSRSQMLQTLRNHYPMYIKKK